ncbi:VapE domain-containing protein [Clostridium beijerinckii]|uniref:P-loop ATPase n=1 Tax=Clostridium beijerinckii TaxID=1520 RepID=A0AAX0BA94_CLOBE|nr:VapE domain-containing protein [Clostridium beijerinckii]NRT92345.1 putative P-loop ATPase [Clostridium beijerinckii]NYC75512.1 putative P-loop ATPase [Clostridium beijerinckii]
MVDMSKINLRELIEKETGQKFNKNNKMLCPIHNGENLSFAIKNDNSMCRCLNCGLGGDVITFVKEYKKITFRDAIRYLNIDNKKYNNKLALIDRLELFIKNNPVKDKNNNPMELIKIYTYVDFKNYPLYFKAKFKSLDDKNESRYYSINGKVSMRRESAEVPYNFYELSHALNKKEKIIIAEDEKDAEILIDFGYVATSLQNINPQKFDLKRFQEAQVYIVPNTGEAGEKYKNNIFEMLKNYVKEFNVINLKGLEELGDDKGISDWFENGNTEDDFKEALKDKWDYKKNRFFKYVNLDGKPLSIWENFKRICEVKEIIIKYNELFKKVEFYGKIFSLDDNDSCFEDIYSICKRSCFSITRIDLNKFIYRIAQENAYNPVRDYLKTCKKNWDRQEGRIKDLANSIITQDEYDDDFKLLLVTKWLIGTANIAFNKGNEHMNGMLIIQGKQGIFKTSWIKTLVPDKSWVASDKVIDARDKDIIVDVTSSWMTEVGEIKATMKPEKLDELKMFVTRETDKYRKPYAAELHEYPRLTSFYGTVNNSEFLIDKTGNRRFWVIKAKEMNLEHGVDINQMWGEVMNLIENKMSHWLTKEEEEKLYVINSAFEVKTEADTKIIDCFDWSIPEDKWEFKTITEICNVLGIKANPSTRESLKNIGAIPPGKNPSRDGGQLKRWWKVPPFEKQEFLMQPNKNYPPRR